MKIKTILLFVFTLTSITVFGQSYRITYKIDTEKMQKRIEKKMANNQSNDNTLLSAVPYLKKLRPTLFIEKNETIYYNQEKMDRDIDRNVSFEIAKIIAGTNHGAIYQNLKTREALEPQKQFDEDFLIKHPFEEYKWKIEDDYKTINGIKTQKATTQLTKGSEDNNEKSHIEAWFTKEIPISSGPLQYGGLPGLIIELTENNFLTLVLNDIEKSPTDKIIIEKPKGDPISLNEFYSKFYKLKKESPYGNFIGN